ncbi:hypothetical protein L843_3161 [Mycobacterium intracellulare MIN_061107_1834]|nr:hypothetical protein L843_3161 [Mycobacterium intracellulare MIN_061107_1834]
MADMVYSRASTFCPLIMRFATVKALFGPAAVIMTVCASFSSVCGETTRRVILWRLSPSTSTV